MRSGVIEAGCRGGKELGVESLVLPRTAPPAIVRFRKRAKITPPRPRQRRRDSVSGVSAFNDVPSACCSCAEADADGIVNAIVVVCLSRKPQKRTPSRGVVDRGIRRFVAVSEQHLQRRLHRRGDEHLNGEEVRPGRADVDDGDVIDFVYRDGPTFGRPPPPRSMPNVHRSAATVVFVDCDSEHGLRLALDRAEDNEGRTGSDDDHAGGECGRV
mmetsp:Transcript_53063/g.163343  ORF Transcript_53063/g.163343 Transcript_53063/m.163343 type:complete len:214 (+) Transcript_53063:53-694(+)